MTMARIKNNVKVKIEVRPKKGLNPNPSLQVSKEELDRCDKENIREWSNIKANLRDSLTRYVYSKTKRQPMILPILMDVDLDKNRN